MPVVLGALVSVQYNGGPQHCNNIDPEPDVVEVLEPVILVPPKL